ncbi:MAG: hypothetical protein IPN75_00265 [Dechloromonas sp.]|uniref:Uncharacterized protein n=1 Tax=Candidatus Dechloromonas phosphorivorans TaxID=2899244 RepID=A0A9D7QIZ6_9RHOO|nr:hypothetical protein [Candidatus Dechloromonas phosphorivorans]
MRRSELAGIYNERLATHALAQGISLCWKLDGMQQRWRLISTARGVTYR